MVFAHKDHLPVAKFTVFRIKCYTAKDISEYSVTQEEQEVLLEPNTLFYVTDTSKTACCPNAALHAVLADMICSIVWASLFSSCCGARRAPGPQPHPPSNTQCSHTHTHCHRFTIQTNEMHGVDDYTLMKDPKQQGLRF